jgi:hypothetical protein
MVNTVNCGLRPTPINFHSKNVHTGGMFRTSLFIVCFSVTSLSACGDSTRTPRGFFSIDSPTDTGDSFFNVPFPSDLRLTTAGTPDFAGYPNRDKLPIVDDLLALARERKGFPVMPLAWFRFDLGDANIVLPPRQLTDVIATTADAPALLIDIDPTSSEKGARYPLVAKTLDPDDYVPSGLLALAPYPGTVLRPSTTYAFVIKRDMAPGFDRAIEFDELATAKTATTSKRQQAQKLFEPLWPALTTAGIAVDDVVAATVFTTGDQVALTRARSETVRMMHDAVISNLRVDPTDGASHEGFCEILGDVKMPQFQQGTAPFNTMGHFELDATGAPQKQRDETIALTITLPLSTMPADGWPLYQFFHGSGGLSSGVVDLGYTATPTGEPEIGKGPGWVVARYGIAAASSALPVNPERVVGASDFAYLNLNNLGAFPYTFQQGVFEQRLLLDALLELQIPANVVTACGARGLALPGAATAHKFNGNKLVAGGQSMGGMYTNMIGAVEGRYGALVPTGAGGFWNLMILNTATIPGARDLISGVLRVDAEQNSFVHPGVGLLSLAWEISDPMPSMARIARRPLPGLPVRNVFETTSIGDTYFPFDIYDAAALAYGNRQAGPSVWPSMQSSLNLDGLGGIASFPVTGNRPGVGGAAATTNVVVQYNGDGIVDPHYIYRQLEPVKHQYGCFLATYMSRGLPTVSAPGPITAVCQ